MRANEILTAPGGEVVVYESKEGQIRLDVRFEQESVSLTRRLMSVVSRSTPENILRHLRDIFSSNELDVEATTKDFSVVRPEGNRSVRRGVKRYNLDATKQHIRKTCSRQELDSTSTCAKFARVSAEYGRIVPHSHGRCRYWTRRRRKQWHEWRLRGEFV